MMKTLALSFGLFVAGVEAKATAKPEYGHAAHKSKHALLAAGDGPIKGKSAAGQHILKHAIPLDHNGNPRKKRSLNQEINISYMADYDLKFIGCYSISTWSMGELGQYDADGEDDYLVRVRQGRVAQFRLCPSDVCEDEVDRGCKEGYGDYAIDLTTFLEAYIVDMANSQEWMCEYYMEKKCNCNGDDQWDDGYNGGNNCYYQCFMENDMQYCLGDGDGNNNNNGNGDFDLEEYIICAESAYGNNNNNNGNYDNIEYIGPYCDEQGGDVYLGSFTDMYCSIATGSKTNYAYGGALPYSKESGQAIVSRDCNPFGQPADDDRYSQYQVKEDFELLYMSAAKCETDMTHNYVSETGCGYMEGLQHVSEDGIIRPGIRPNIITTAFIGLFFTSSVLLGSYVYYLRNKILSGAKVNLAYQ